MTVYVCPALPDELETLRVMEEMERGGVTLGGHSDVLELTAGTQLDLIITASGSSLGMETKSFFGETIHSSFDFDPEDLRAAAKRDVGPGGGAGGGAGGDLREVSAYQKDNMIEAEIHLAVSISNPLLKRRGGRERKQAPPPPSHSTVAQPADRPIHHAYTIRCRGRPRRSTHTRN